jgi:hypothetical protein
MSRRQLVADLDGLRALVWAGRLADAPAEFWLDSARARLRELDFLLAAPPRRVRLLLIFPLVWGAASGAAALHLPAAWGLVAALAPLALRRRRTYPPAGPPAPVTVIRDELVRARVRLVSAALREAGSRRWSVPVLTRLAADHATIARLAEADRTLCQAIDFIEIYLTERDLRRAA